MDDISVATMVYKCALKSQSYIYTIHGPGSEHKYKEEFPQLKSTHLRHKHFYVESNQPINIYPQHENFVPSIILSGLDRNSVIVHGKINHLIVRRCEHSSIDLIAGTISGIDILHTKNSTIHVPTQTFTGVAYCDNIYLVGKVTDLSRFQMIHSADVMINREIAPINPFTSAGFIAPTLTMYQF